MSDVVRATKKKPLARKAVGAMEAIISAFRDPSVKETIDKVLSHQAQMAAERSVAGRTQKLFSTASDPAVLAAVDVMLKLVADRFIKRR